MTDRGVSDSDMPNFSWLPRRDGSGIPDPALSALLAGRELPPDAPASVEHLTDVLAALRAVPADDELAGKAVALTEFRRRIGVSEQSAGLRRRRPTLLTSLLSAKAATVAAVAALGLGGVATAAFANALPAPAQRLAHDTIGAPSPHASHSTSPNAGHSGTPVGPNATGSAAFGLCTAYAHATQQGTAAQKSVAFRNLEKAAGGAANVASFCASVKHPGATPSPSHPTGAPAAHPTGEPSVIPSAHPTGKPSSVPSAHPTAQPSHP